MLINLSNHPYSTWDTSQKEAGACFGDCIDLPFPNVNPKAEEREISQLAEDYVTRIIELAGSEEVTVHVMGELTFCYSIVSRLLTKGIDCVASCSARDVTELEDGTKQVRFHFERFRKYIV